MDFREIVNIKIPEGVVKKITTLNGNILWIKKGGGDIVIPNNEIWYTSTDGNIVELSRFYNGVQPISNTYENGLAKMVFENDLTEIGQQMFDSCNTLYEITLPNSITSIIEWAFFECENLTKITIPNSVTIIDYEAFYNCTSLTSIEIPNSVTNIGNGAFNRCTSLTSIEIPNSVTTLESNVFYNCTSLQLISCLNSIAPRIQSNTFSSVGSAVSGSKVLRVPNNATGYDVWLEQLKEFKIQYIE